MTRGRRGVAVKIPAGQCAIVAANIRVLRQRKGWSQAKLGELMGWPSASTVCAAEGTAVHVHGSGVWGNRY
jgi:hypothetical protein